MCFPTRRARARAFRIAVASVLWTAAAGVLPGPTRLPAAAAAEPGLAGKSPATPHVAPASDEARRALKNFRLPPGWKVELIAAEPDLANPVAFAFDEQERIYVVETFRLGEGVLDIRGRGDWPSAGFKKGLPADRVARLVDETLDADLACRTVEDREKMLRMYFAEKVGSLEQQVDRVRLLARGPDGQVTSSTVFSTGYNQLADGLASGVLARGGKVWFANIPHLWRLEDTNDDGVAEERKSLHQGYGVRVGFLGHDLHGLCWGPDGRLYFTIGDRGASVTTQEGRRLETPDSGAVFRCEPDGANLEIFARGLRNPQELVFDALGNLWTGDNNSDGGDQARWTYLVEDGDCGWHVGWQYLESPNPRGPWNSEGMWRPEEAPKIGYLIPPLANIGAGPSGITYNFGTGLSADLAGHFFMTDFRGGPCGIWTFGVKPKGAGYEVDDLRQLIWNALPTDVEVGPDGGLYWSDWVQGWEKPGKGRLYRAYDPAVTADARVKETRALLLAQRGDARAGSVAANIGKNWRTESKERVLSLLGHPDLRVRREVQFGLADANALDLLVEGVAGEGDRYRRLHALWGLGQIARRPNRTEARARIATMLGDSDPEIRAQTAKLVGDLRITDAGGALEQLLVDPEPRSQFFAAIALGKLGRREAGPGLVALLRRANNQDPYLRHAGVMGLVGTRHAEELAALTEDASAAVRLAAVVALRRLESPLLSRFLTDPDPAVVIEAARAIHDLSLASAMPALAALITRAELAEPLWRRVLNANLRVGGEANAVALIAFALDASHPEVRRAEAVRLLGQFATPSGRDEVTGLWRPAPARDATVVRQVFQASFAALLTGPETVRAAAARAAGKVNARDTAPQLRALAMNTQAPASARTAALQVLAEWRDAGLEVVLGKVGGDANEQLRNEALRWQTQLGIGEVLGLIRTALERGSIGEKQTAMTGLASLKSEAADSLLLFWLARGAAGQTPREMELEMIEAARQRADSSRLVATALRSFESSLGDTNTVAGRRYLLRGGDATAGRKVFFEAEAVQCLRCHRAGGDGGVVGPDLAGIGTRQTREYLLESILHPNAAIAQGFDNVMIETRDGRELAGTVQKETDAELVLNTPDAGTQIVAKSEITSRRKGLSSMPEGLGDILSPRDLRDLVEFLASLPAK